LFVSAAGRDGFAPCVEDAETNPTAEFILGSFDGVDDELNAATVHNVYDAA
jgi:hypothetical protein